MGAKIHGASSDTIVIQGVDALHGTDYAVMPDRIETVNWRNDWENTNRS